MSACSLNFLQSELYASNPALLLADNDGLITVTVPPGETLDADAVVTLFTLLEQRPFYIEWAITTFHGIIALGVAFDGSTTLLGEGVANMYYTSDGRIIVHGSVYALAPPYRPGDTVGMWLDVAHSAGAFFLNGVRVA